MLDARFCIDIYHVDKRAHSGQQFPPIPDRRLCPCIGSLANLSDTLYSAELELGEPKSYPKESQFNRYWSRPKRDGSALRAIAQTDYCGYLLDKYMVKNIA
jgi:hypothetical protein